MADAATAGLLDTRLLGTRLDRESPVPIYFQLSSVLADGVRGGRWKPGERLPGEADLCRHFSVSRTTVRQAIDRLEREGLARRIRGRGTFVTEARPGSWLLQSSLGFHREVTALGHRVTSRVLTRELGPLPAWAADGLGVEPGTAGFVLERLRFVDDAPAMYVFNYLPADLFDAVAGADLERESLYEVLERRCGLAVAGGQRVVDAVVADERLGGLLAVGEGAALLEVTSVSWDARLRPFECYRAWHVAGRTGVKVQVVGEAAARAAPGPEAARAAPGLEAARAAPARPTAARAGLDPAVPKNGRRR